MRHAVPPQSGLPVGYTLFSLKLGVIGKGDSVWVYYQYHVSLRREGLGVGRGFAFRASSHSGDVDRCVKQNKLCKDYKD